MAQEPDGAIVLRAVREDADHLRVTLQAVGPVEQVVVTWTVPQGLTLQAELPEGTPRSDRVALELLAAGTVQTLRLRLTGAPDGKGAIAVIRVEGLFRGRPIREALGVPVASPQEGRLRGDVLEFPAAVEP